MPDLYLDFSWTHPSPGDMADVGVRGILVYITPNPHGVFNTPDRGYLDECISRGISVSPIFETAGERANEGYHAGREDGLDTPGWMDRIGVPDGVRLFVNVADTPISDGHLQAIGDYARGFAETCPSRWQLGAYGNHAALYAAQYAAPRFEKLWAVETWGAPPGSPDAHFQWWVGQPHVVLVQMANVPPPLPGTDANWLVPGQVLDAWGGNAPKQRGIRYPLDGEMRVNSPWGPRGGGFHYGIDLWAMNGDPAYAVADGTCFYQGFEPGGAGNHIAFYFDVPPIPAAEKYGYMHMQDFAVQVGEHVREGQLIGHTNNTGGSQGPHLHFWCGTNASTGAIDPTPLLLAGPPEPDPSMPDLSWLESALAGMRGDNAVAMVLYGPYEVSFHVNDAGQLIHNSVDAHYGIVGVRDEVLLEGLDTDVQPAVRVANNNVIVTAVDAGGGMRRIAWVGGQGRWVDTLDNNAELADIHPM